MFIIKVQIVRKYIYLEMIKRSNKQQFSIASAESMQMHRTEPLW